VVCVMSGTRRRNTVVMTPVNVENPYLPLLQRSLGKVDWSSVWLANDLTKSQTLNSLLVPFALLQHRFRGARVLHMHWAYNFHWAWAKGLPLIQRIPRYWFWTTIVFSKMIGFSFVYTWHDHLPLTPIFDDDLKAFTFVARQVDTAITITEAARERLIEEWGIDPSIVYVIPEGAPEVASSPTREEARQNLDVRYAPLIASFGNVDPYKGIDLLLQAALTLPNSLEFAIRILGVCRNREYSEFIESLIRELQLKNRDVHWSNRHFEDSELTTLLAGADLAVMPFRWITNSTTMRMSMAYGLVTVLPNLPELSDVPRDAAIFFDQSDPRALATTIETAIGEIATVNTSRIVSTAQSWVNSWTWLEVAQATAGVYEGKNAVEQ